MIHTHPQYLEFVGEQIAEWDKQVKDGKERLFARTIHLDNGCIEWAGCVDNHGYGRIYYRGRVMKTHRLSWILANGEIPEGMFVCHKCDNPPCLNIEHLWLGEQKENMKDCVIKGRHFQASKTQCANGHLYDDANTYTVASGGRNCRKCHNDVGKRSRAAKRAVTQK